VRLMIEVDTDAPNFREIARLVGLPEAIGLPAQPLVAVPPPAPVQDDGLWDLERTSRYLGVSERTVRKHKDEGALPVAEVGGRKLLFHPDVVREFARRPRAAGAQLKSVAGRR
jgi:hypothetical protein